MDIVTVTNLTKTFGHGPRQVKALDGITLGVEKGKFTAIVGASGSGKTTLLNCIGGLYRPDSGAVTVDGQDLASLTEEQLTVYRRRKIGFVFQGNHLVPELTVQENILFPLALDDARPDWDFFREITRLLGLTGKLDALPHTLSGGAQQCTAIARALMTKPALLLADEPTGSFDAKTTQNVAGLLKLTAETFHQTLIMITHNEELARLPTGSPASRTAGWWPEPLSAQGPPAGGPFCWGEIGPKRYKSVPQMCRECDVSLVCCPQQQQGGRKPHEPNAETADPAKLCCQPDQEPHGGAGHCPHRPPLHLCGHHRPGGHGVHDPHHAGAEGE